MMDEILARSYDVDSRELDHLVDTGVANYYEARAMQSGYFDLSEMSDTEVSNEPTETPFMEDSSAPRVTPTKEDEDERRLDDLVDKRGISYAMAREILGIPDQEARVSRAQVGYPQNFSTRGRAATAASSAAHRARNAAMGPQYGEERGVGFPGGLPPELQPRKPWSPEQHAIHAAGRLAATQAIAANKLTS